MIIEGIACIERNGGLSFQNNLPWLKDKIGDLEYVRIITSLTAISKKNVIVLGRKTLEILPDTFFKNSNRIICVLSKNLDYKTRITDCDIHIFNNPSSIFSYLLELNKKSTVDRCFVFGGSEIYKYFLENSYISRFYLTRIYKDYECDTYFCLETLKTNYKLSSASEIDTKDRVFEIWERNEHPEYSYLNLLEEVYLKGEKRETRNGITYSLFGKTLEFNVNKFGFPLLTTKKMFFKGIVKELLWFLKGDTNVQHLMDEGVHIWDGNTTRDFLDSIGLNHYPERCAGPIYGYQWRFFNASYDHLNMRPLEKGTDQLVNCIEEIKTNPSSRRLLISGWNPEQLNEMCLPPCHVLYQFYVVDGLLCAQMYQRSADLFLGLPFNIASTALLTYIIASITNYNVGTIKICIGDAHIYSEHIDNVLEQITRKPLNFCKLNINNKHKDLTVSQQLESIQFSDITLEDYISHGTLKSLMKA